MELCRKKGYAGTAIFTKEEPKDVFYGINEPFYDNEGRVITLEFENYFFLTCYTPNSQSELKRLEYRMSWEEKFLTYLKKLEKTKPVILCGDLNVAHKEIDLKIRKRIWVMPGLPTKKEKIRDPFRQRLYRHL